jgi:hypothetical protein
LFVFLGAIIPTRPVARAPPARVIVTPSPAKVPAADPKNVPMSNLIPPRLGLNWIVDALMSGAVASAVEIDDTAIVENTALPVISRLGQVMVDAKMLDVCRPVVRN